MIKDRDARRSRGSVREQLAKLIVLSGSIVSIGCAIYLAHIGDGKGLCAITLALIGLMTAVVRR